MKTKTVKWRTLWRAILHIAFFGGAAQIAIGYLTSNRYLSDVGAALVLPTAVLLLWSITNELRERIIELERRDHLRDRTDAHAAAVIANLMDSAHRIDPAYVEAERKRLDREAYMRKLRETA